MRFLRLVFLMILLTVLSTACRKEPRTETIPTEGVTVFLKMERRENFTKGLNTDAFVDPQSVYVLLFDGSNDDSRLLEYSHAVPQPQGNFSVSFNVQKGACYAYVITNVAKIIEVQSQSWAPGTTLKSIRESLYAVALPQENGMITAMPAVHPMVAGYDLPTGVTANTTIGTANSPVELVRATSKLSVAYSGGGTHFEVLGINLGNAPCQGFVFPDVNGNGSVAPIPTAAYAAHGDLTQMLAGANPVNPQETNALYAYESLSANGTYVILKAKYNGIEGYYRIDLYNKDKSEHLPLLRNYYYRITVSRVMKPGYPTPQDAIDHPEDNGLNTTIEVIDPYSHEIISDGTHFLGVSNSELWIYDSYVMNEFNLHSGYFMSPDKLSNYESANWGNGFVATTLTYACDPSWPEGRVTADNGIRFRKGDTNWNVISDELILEKAISTPITRHVIIAIPHDFKQGTVTIRIGPMEKQILIKRSDVISVMGDVLDLGTGFSMAKVDYSLEFYPKEDFLFPGLKPQIKDVSLTPHVRLSTSPHAAGSQKEMILNESDRLYVHVAPSQGIGDLSSPQYKSTKFGLSEFYVSRSENQARIKVHLLREGFSNLAKDMLPTSGGYAFNNAFWRNDQTGERLVLLPFQQGFAIRWSARVIYGTDFIRLAKSHRELSTTEIRNSNAEDFQPDETWGTFLQCDFLNDAEEKSFRGYNPPNFRIGLSSKNTMGKPRYGLVLIQMPTTPSTTGSSHAYWIYIRQGEEADYVLRPTDQINGQTCQYALKVSPFNLTVPNPMDHPGGPDYTDHQPLQGLATFTDYPSQIGYLFQHGNDRAFHPTNPESNDGPNGMTYDYGAPFIDICPEGFQLPPVDHDIDVGSNNASKRYTNSFLHSLGMQPLGGYSYCADGYCDRINYPHENPKLPLEYQRPAWMQEPPGQVFNADLGPRSPSRGKFFYNPHTLAGVFLPEAPCFIPKGSSRAAAVQDLKLNYWAIIHTRPNDTTEALYSDIHQIVDRGAALPIRPVKK